MYDRRPASRVTLGTPTVAGFTLALLSAVLGGSCQLAISSPLRGRRARSLPRIYRGCLRGLQAKPVAIALGPVRCDTRRHAEGARRMGGGVDRRDADRDERQPCGRTRATPKD